jgi:hypothetical protein
MRQRTCGHGSEGGSEPWPAAAVAAASCARAAAMRGEARGLMGSASAKAAAPAEPPRGSGLGGLSLVPGAKRSARVVRPRVRVAAGSTASVPVAAGVTAAAGGGCSVAATPTTSSWGSAARPRLGRRLRRPAPPPSLSLAAAASRVDARRPRLGVRRLAAPGVAAAAAVLEAAARRREGVMAAREAGTSCGSTGSFVTHEASILVQSHHISVPSSQWMRTRPSG